MIDLIGQLLLCYEEWYFWKITVNYGYSAEPALYSSTVLVLYVHILYSERAGWITCSPTRRQENDRPAFLQPREVYQLTLLYPRTGPPNLQLPK